MLLNISLIFLEMISSSHLNDNNILYNFKCSVNSFPNVFITAQLFILKKMSVYAVFEPSSWSFSFTVLPRFFVMFLQTLSECFLNDGVLPEATEAVHNDFNSSIEGCFWNIHMIWLTCQCFSKKYSEFYLPIFYHSKIKMFKMNDFEWSRSNLRN